MFWTAVLVCLAAGCYMWLRHRYSYFKRLGIAHDSPPWIVGSSWRVFLKKAAITDAFHTFYNLFPNEPLVGIFQVMTPTIIVKDPGLLKRMLVDDFCSFHSHGFEVDEETNPLDGHLFNLHGEKWRTLRRKLSPTFTSGKLKGMFSLIDVCATSLMKTLKADLTVSEEIEVRDLLARFTTDVIGSCAFGLDTESIKDKDSPFRVMGSRIFKNDWKQILKFALVLISPSTFRALKLKTMPDDISEFYLSVVKQGFEHRQRTGKVRNDFLQLLLELKNKGSVEIDPRDVPLEEDFNVALGKEEKIEMTVEVLAAQAFAFFIAGFETTAAILGFTMYYLAKDKKIQDQARTEVLAASSKNGITYETLANMPYLSACLSEALRLEPPFRVVFRECKRDTVLGGIPIEKGTLLSVPIYSLHRDPAHFPDPESFRPERFIGEPSHNPSTYIPFGDGPRMCIARRFALLEAKLTLAKIISEYSFELGKNTTEPFSMDPGSFIPNPIGGVWIKFTTYRN